MFFQATQRKIQDNLTLSEKIMKWSHNFTILNTRQSLHIQISLQLKYSFNKPQRGVWHPQLKGNIATTEELELETKKRNIVRLVPGRNLDSSVANDVGCSQSAVSKIWCKYKGNGVVKKRKLY